MTRLPSFMAGLAALILMAPLARRIVGNLHAVWAFAFLAVCRQAVDHGCEVHSYTLDLLNVELVLYCTAILLENTASAKTRIWASMGLGVVAVLGLWTSYSTSFALGGASLALAFHLRRHGTKREWMAWLAFNALVCVSGVLLWWFSARHKYYSGMIEHWQQGWGGFPDWNSSLAIGRWLLERPVEIGNYGNRELGIILTLLSILGGIALAKRSLALTVLLTVPFLLAVTAALLGKYPLADRTCFFLLPCMWLLAACGIGSIIEWGRVRGRELAVACLLLLVLDFSWTIYRIAIPDKQMDFRGAYEFVHAHKEPTDNFWSMTAIVHETYYGKSDSVLMDKDLEEALNRAKSQRVWVVVGINNVSLRERFEANARVAYKQNFSRLDVLLFEPKNDAVAVVSSGKTSP